MVIVIQKLVDGCDTNAQGAVVNELLHSYLMDRKHIVLDFTGVFNVTSSFVNTAFVDLLDVHDTTSFKKLVGIKGANRQVSDMIRSRVQQAAAKQKTFA